MATLCEDTGQGRVSSKASQVLDNHAAWKRSNKEKRAHMRALMEAKKYGRREDTDERCVLTPTVGPSSSEPATSTETPARPMSSPATPAPATASENGFGFGFGFDYGDTMATSRFNVQVRIGPNGETIVDEESLFVDRAEEHDTNNYVHVEESDATKFVNSGSYSKKFRGARWTVDETEAFYAVSVIYHALRPNERLTGSLSIRRELRIDVLCPPWARSKGLQSQIQDGGQEKLSTHQPLSQK